jgi:hypothetical protein
MSDTVSAESIRAQMPHGTLTRITGEATHKQLKILEKELAANLMAIPCPWGHGKGHLGPLQDPVLYLQRNGAAFTVPAVAPPEYLLNPPAAAPTQEAAQAANLANRKAWNTYIIVRTITRDQFAAAIDDVYYAALNDPTEGLNTISLRNLVTHIRTTYALISQPDIDNNMTEFYTSIKASLPLAIYMRKQEKCQTFAQDAGVTISEATMVTTGTKAALNCGSMELGRREQKRHPLVDQTWNNWKLHWTAAFSETRDIHWMTANDGAFANQVAAKAEQAAMMARLLDNLTNATLQKNNTVEKLMTANEKLAKALANANAAIADLRLPTPATAPAGGSKNRPSHWSPVIPDWDPTGYCLSHGFKVKCGHTSATCAHCKAGHNAAATRLDTKGGSKANKRWTPA